MSLSRILKKELTAQPVGIPCDKILFYQGVKQHYCDYPIIAKSYGTAQLFSSAKPYIYDSDQIAGSIRGIFSSEYDERLHNHAEKWFHHTEQMDLLQIQIILHLIIGLF